MIQATGVDHVVLHVDNVQRGKKFYTEVLGMTFYREDPGQVFLRAGPQGVALFKKAGDAPLTAGNDLNHLALNVAVGTYETLKADLERQGLRSPDAPATTAAFTFVIPTDTACS
jgi:catechol 2,3-dioxygenase-like lactoylglutathione lyase family enzyme